MSAIEDIITGHKTAESRWARLGPYYAMFPLEFAFETIENYSDEGNYILDPFAGRFSSIYAGSVNKRKGLGIEINPVGWLYGAVKVNPAPFEVVLKRLDEVHKKCHYYQKTITKMHKFWRMCFCDEVLAFLLSAKKNLDWKNKKIDATLMAIILVHLHGKLGEGLSNQMKMTKAMAINYSVKWWEENGMEKPPEINPFDFIKKKLEWRYEKGLPKTEPDTQIMYGDSTTVLKRLSSCNREKYSLLFTSPPYCSVTNYYSDQWLRFWMLGGPGNSLYLEDRYKKRFINKEDYYYLLNTVFSLCSKMMKQKSTVYVRTDVREYTKNVTIEILKNNFPDHKMYIIDAPSPSKTQTEVLGNRSLKKGETDIIMTRG